MKLMFGLVLYLGLMLSMGMETNAVNVFSLICDQFNSLAFF